jgi:hypothetical protein
VLGRHALRRVGLQEDAQHPAFEREVVGVGGAEADRERVVDVRNGDAERPRLDSIDVDAQLRRFLQPLRTDADHHLAL